MGPLDEVDEASLSSNHDYELPVQTRPTRMQNYHSHHNAKKRKDIRRRPYTDIELSDTEDDDQTIGDIIIPNNSNKTSVKQKSILTVPTKNARVPQAIRVAGEELSRVSLG